MSKLLFKRFTNAKDKRSSRIRTKIRSLSSLPRLTVVKSNKFVYAQIIDDQKGKTLAGVKGKVASEVGKMIAEKALKLGVEAIVFDRGEYRYHGQVKLIAESARAAGLKF